MAVENVEMMNVVGKLSDVNRFAKDIFLFNDIQLLDAMGEIDSGRFTLPVAEKNLDELLGFASLMPGADASARKIYEQKQRKIASFYDDNLKFDPKTVQNECSNPDEILTEADSFIAQLTDDQAKLVKAEEDLQKIEESLTAYSYLQEIKVPLKELFGMKYFSVSLGSMTKDTAERFKNIYPSITSIVFHVGTTDTGEKVYLVVTENEFKVETDRILKALNFVPIPGINEAYTQTPQEVLQILEKQKKELVSEIERLKAQSKLDLKDNYDKAVELYNLLSMLMALNVIKGYMAFSDKNFYFSGWIPVKKEETLKKISSTFPGMIMMFEVAGADAKPPTKLKNNWLFRPFEQLVKMYGVPNYDELDPTPFLSLTYMFCFGYMFGDVGQGLVLLLGGLLAEKKGIKLGGVAARVAVSSIIFGFIYGSIFGNETILTPLWLRPMEDTNTLLITAVVFGVLMLIVAYIYGIINKLRNYNIDQGWFGKNGISGFILYLTILVTALGVMNYIPVPSALVTAGIMIIIGLTVVIYLQEPLTNRVLRRPFMKGITGEYYVSSFFECFEMYLSMLSNTLSFIRVGAFALTHAGMFMAFETIAEMAGGGVAGTIIMIIGNIFIICLEGLIDFIQCLRLEFYELFGKYYDGGGSEFENVTESVKAVDPSL